MVPNSSDTFFADERRALLLADTAHARLIDQARSANGGSNLISRLGDTLISLGYGLKGGRREQSGC